MRRVARERVPVGDRDYEIITLRALGYRAHTSPRRALDHWLTGRDLRRKARAEQPPQIICCGLPTLDLGSGSRVLASEFDCPLVIDVQDLWPDIFLEVVSRRLRPLAEVMLTPWYRTASRTCRSATAIVGITDEFVDWGLSRAGRDRTERDLVIPLAHERPGNSAMADGYWRDAGVDLDKPIVAFAGSFSRNLDFVPVLETARRWSREEPRVQFVLCGDGPDLGRAKEMAAGLENVWLPGWIGGPPLTTLFHSASVGIAPYVQSASFLGSIPNKVIEYLAHGLPVVCSLDGGVAGRMLETENCGVTYSPEHERSLDAALRRALGDAAGGSSMATAARRVFAEKFDSREVYGRLARLLEELAVSRAT
jgi:glycosyltransferase involved in cell wall biosynthesis